MRLIAAALLASAAFAQNDDARVFNFIHISSPQSMQEFVNAARSIGEIRDLVVDPQSKSFKLSGTPARIAITQWLLDSLDQPAAPASFGCRDTAFPEGQRGDTAVKVCYLVHVANPVALQETINAVRALAEIQYATAFTAAPAIIVRTSPEAAAFAEWIMRNLDEAATGAARRETRQYRFEDNRYFIPVERRREAVRIYYPQTIRSPLELQETINILRSIVEIQRIVAFTGFSAILFRSNDREAEAADWILRQLDGPGPTAASTDFTGETVRTLIVPGSPTPRQIADTVNQIRSATGMQRVVMYQARKTIVLRGTPQQLAAAESLLH